MKMKTMIGSIALTAALAMGSIPAFAAQAEQEVSKFDDSEAGKTEIKGKVEKQLNPQLKASVPLKFVVVFNGSNGTEALTVATESAGYGITNTGSKDIKVSSITMEEKADAIIKNEALLFDGTDWYSETDDSGITTGRYIMITYSDGTNKNFITPSHDTTKWKKKVGATQNDETYITGATNFTAPVISATAGSNFLPITLGGKAFMGTPVTNDNLTDTLCTIKYTIADATA